MDVSHELGDLIKSDWGLHELREVLRNLKADEIQPIKDNINLIIKANAENTATDLFPGDA